MQIKTTLRFYLTPIRMAKIKNSGDNKCCWECGERRTLICSWWDFKLVQPLWKSTWRFLRKLEIDLPEYPVTPLLGIYPKDAQPCHRHTCSTMFTAALFVITRSWKQPRCPTTEEWIQKMWFIYIVEYYSAIKNKDIMNFSHKWMELQDSILSKVTQTQKNFHAIYPLISGY